MYSVTHVFMHLYLLLSLHRFIRLSETIACCHAPAHVGCNEPQDDVATIESKAWLVHAERGVRMGVVYAGLIG